MPASTPSSTTTSSITSAGRARSIFAERLTEHFGGAKIYLKREDLNHTGAHKINNCMGQVLLARRMGKTRHHRRDGRRPARRRHRHGLPHCSACPAPSIWARSTSSGRSPMSSACASWAPRCGRSTPARATLKDAMNEALARLGRQRRGHLLPHRHGRGPPPLSGTWCAIFSSSSATRRASRSRRSKGGCPTRSSPASAAARMPWGCSIPSSTTPASPSSASRRRATASRRAGTPHPCWAGGPACCTATAPISCRTSDGQISEAHSISAGLDYPGVGPEHAWLKDTGRVSYVAVTDREALDAFQRLSRLEGIIPALESAHALAYVGEDRAPRCARDHLVVVCLSGRGDKDIFTVAEHLGASL